MNEESTGPTLPNLSDDKRESKELISSPKEDIEKNKTQEKEPIKDTKNKTKVNPHEIVRKWGVQRRRMRDGMQTLMLREIKEVVPMTKVNEIFRRNINELMQAQLTYFEEMIDIIEKAEDPLSKKLMKNEDRKASTIVFESLQEIISEELKSLEMEKPIITEYIDEDLKRFRDARIEPRATWWVIWYSALQLREMRERSGEQLDIVLRVLLQYKPVMRRVLGIMFNFLDQLIQQFDPFPLNYTRVNLIENSTGTGYNMAPWIKPRYGTYSQSDMEYKMFITYYARSFGTVSGNAPDFEGGPIDGYRKWIQRTLDALEKQMRTSPLITQNARGDTLEGMLVGIEDQLKKVIANREFDDNGKLINQPIGGEGALKFVQWLFHTALNRYSTTNIAIHKEARLSLDMFNFVKDTVRWVNEYGEQIVMDWLIPFEDE